jgi:RHS repeat-associated protein
VLTGGVAARLSRSFAFVLAWSVLMPNAAAVAAHTDPASPLLPRVAFVPAAIVAAAPLTPAVPGEIVDRRTRTSSTQRNADGTLTTTTFGGSLHYRDESGLWRPISTDLVPSRDVGFAYGNGANSFGVLFKDGLDADFLRFETRGKAFTLQLPGASTTARARADGHGVQFDNAVGGTSLRYDLFADGVRETLVLPNANAASRYHFQLKTPNDDLYEPQRQADGSWAFFARGQLMPLFVLEAPTVSETVGGVRRPAPGAGATLTVAKLTPGFAVYISVDDAWLHDAARQFPIEIDPTMSITPPTDDGVWFVGCCGSQPGKILLVGSDPTFAYRAGVQFDISGIPTGATITNAQLKLFATQCINALSCAASHTLEAHRVTNAWTHSTMPSMTYDVTVLSTATLPAGAQQQWLSWDVTATVQNWRAGTQTNYGLLIKRDTEALNSDGGTFSSRGADEPTLRPQLQVTYRDGVDLFDPDTLHANGAELRWTRWTSAINEPFDKYEVHRSANPSFTPGASTLLTTIRDIAVTSFRDTTAAPGATFTYKVVANTYASYARTVTLPAAGQSKKVLQPNPTEGKASTIYGVTGQTSCTNYGASDSFWVGPKTDGITRGLIQFDVRDIPADATITAATMSLWRTGVVLDADTVIDVHRATRAWTEATGNATCSADGATWTETQGGIAWATPGGDFDPTVSAFATLIFGAKQLWIDWSIGSLVGQWAHGDQPNFGMALTNHDEALGPNKMAWFHSDDQSAAPSLRPKLVITYTDGTQAIAPTVSISSPAAGAAVRGTVTVSAAASDDGKVASVQFFANGVPIGTATSAPFQTAWNTVGAPASSSLTATATDDAGNSATSSAVVVNVDNSAAPTTSITAPLNNANVSGTVTVNANATDDVGVTKVEFYIDDSRFAEDTTSPYSVSLNTLDPALPVYDGTHTITSRAYDGAGQVTISAAITVNVVNTSATMYKAMITTPTSTSGFPLAVTYDPDLTPQEASGMTINLTNNGNAAWSATSVYLYYRWYSPDAPAQETAAPGASTTVTDSARISLPGTVAKNGGTATLTVQVIPPTLLPGVEQSKYRLHFDLYDTVASAWFGVKGNPPLQNPITVNKKLKTALGIERYYHYQAENLGGGMVNLVNVASGNSVLRWTPWSAPGRGLSTVLDLTYNSLEKKSRSPIGNNWSLAISSLSRFGEPIDIHPNNSDAIAGRSNKYIRFTDGDGTTFRFDASPVDPNVYLEPPGVHLYVRLSPDLSKGQWAITRPDRVTFYYDATGFPTRVEDANGNAVTFTLETTPAGEDPGGPAKRITEVIDAAGQGGSPAPNRKFTLSYYTKNEVKKPHIRGKIKDITDHNGSVLHFDYYEDGNLLRITQRGGIGTSADVAPVAGRTFVLTYTTPDGSGPAIPDAQTAPFDANRVNPDPKTNQSTALYSVRDARGAETKFAYFGPTSGQLRWKLMQRTDRNGQTTSFGYDLTLRETTATAPVGRVTKFDYDTDGKLTTLIDAVNRQTLVEWSTDFHVTKVTEPGTPAPITQYAYNANGYLTQRIDALGNTTVLTYQDVAADTRDVSTAWKTGRTIPHLSQLATKTDPKGVATPTPTDDYQWAFIYDPKGNLTQVTDPEHAITTFTYNADGTLATKRDANLKTTQFQTYDANGLVTRIVDAKLQTTNLTYNDDGLLTSVQDPVHASDTGTATREYRTTYDYDAFHRLVVQSAPKSTSTARGILVWSAVQYDANDNTVTQLAPQYGALSYASVGAAPRTTVTYDAMDRRLQTTGPDTSADPAGERTAYQYDAAGRLTRLMQPKGVQTTNTDQDFAAFFEYDALDRVTKRTQYAVNAGGTVTDTRTSLLCYGAQGDLTSVTSPRAGLTSVDCSSPTTPYTTRYTYDLAHRRLTTTDALAHQSGVTFDANGNVATLTDPTGALTTRNYDQRNLVTKIIEPFNGTRTLTTKLEYDPVGSLKRVVSPRGWDASADKITFSSYATRYQYDDVDQLIRIDLPVDATYTQQQYLHRGYDADGQLTFTSLPVTVLDPALLGVDDKTTVDRFDSGWIRALKAPATSRTQFDYAAQGWQTRRAPETATGSVDVTKQALWDYYPGGRLKKQTDVGGQEITFSYDANGQLTAATDTSSLNTANPLNITAAYTAFNELQKTRQKDPADVNWTFSTFVYDANGNLTTRHENGTEDTVGVQVTAPRSLMFIYDGADWLATQVDDNGTTDLLDDQKIINVFDAAGRETRRTIQKYDGVTPWAGTQETNWAYFQNGKLSTLITKNGAGTTLESHTIVYESGGVYLNGNRASDQYVLAGPDPSAPCYTPATACTATYGYDPRDRLAGTSDGHGGTYSYTLDTAGNATTAVEPTGTKTMTYTGTQLTSLTVGTTTQKYWYDGNGNLDCVTTATGAQGDCPVAAGGTVSPKLLSDYRYDYLDRLLGFQSYTTDGVTSMPKDSSAYTFDALSRPVAQTDTRGPAGAPTTATYSYLGLSDRLGQEQQKDQAGALIATKSYAYDAYGHRVAMTRTPAVGSAARYNYGTDPHGSVSLLIDPTGASNATYGYTAYGDADGALTKGDADLTSVLNPYRYTGKRLDAISGSYDMGTRRFGPDTGRFLQRDRYMGALADLGLSLDPLTANRYSLAGGNPITYVETDGHAFTIGDDGGACTDPACAGNSAGGVVPYNDTTMQAMAGTLPQTYGAVANAPPAAAPLATGGLSDVVKAGIEDVLDASAAFAASRIGDIGFWVRSATTMQASSTWAIIETELTTGAISPLTKVALQNVGKMGVAAGFAQGIADYFFHPELSVGQRLSRIAIGAAVGIAAVAAAPLILGVAGVATTGLVGAAITLAVGSAVAFAIDQWAVRPYIYPALGLGD